MANSNSDTFPKAIISLKVASNLSLLKSLLLTKFMCIPEIQFQLRNKRIFLRNSITVCLETDVFPFSECKGVSSKETNKAVIWRYT